MPLGDQPLPAQETQMRLELLSQHFICMGVGLEVAHGRFVLLLSHGLPRLLLIFVISWSLV